MVRRGLVKIEPLISALWSMDSLNLWQGSGGTVVPIAVKNIEKVLLGLKYFLYGDIAFHYLYTIIFGMMIFQLNIPNNLLRFSIMSCFIIVIGTCTKWLVRHKEKKPWYTLLCIFGSLYLTATYLRYIVSSLTNRSKIVKWGARTYKFKMSAKQ